MSLRDAQAKREKQKAEEAKAAKAAEEDRARAGAEAGGGAPAEGVAAAAMQESLLTIEQARADSAPPGLPQTGLQAPLEAQKCKHFTEEPNPTTLLPPPRRSSASGSPAPRAGSRSSPWTRSSGSSPTRTPSTGRAPPPGHPLPPAIPPAIPAAITPHQPTPTPAPALRELTGTVLRRRGLFRPSINNRWGEGQLGDRDRAARDALASPDADFRPSDTAWVFCVAFCPPGEPALLWQASVARQVLWETYLSDNSGGDLDEPLLTREEFDAAFNSAVLVRVAAGRLAPALSRSSLSRAAPRCGVAHCCAWTAACALTVDRLRC